MNKSEKGLRLSDAVVLEAKCPDGRKDVMVFDRNLPGFGLRVTSKGSRIFFLQYKIGGRLRRAVIGRFGEITAAQARKKAESLRGQVRDQHDPVADRKAALAASRRAEELAKAQAAKDAFTVNVLIDSWRDLHLIEQSASYHAHVPKAMKSALKSWLNTPANTFSQVDAVQVLDTTKRSRGPIAANRLRAYCRSCWGWAMKRGSLVINPWAATPRPSRERSRERVLENVEVAAVWRAAVEMDHPWNLIIRLLLLTGQRRQEVAGMTWQELDLAAAEWRLPATRTKNQRSHIVPLAPELVQMLQDAPRSGKLVFQNARGTAPSGFGKVSQRLIKATKEAGGTDHWVLHDLRRTVATGLQRLGVRLEVTEAILNHVSGSRSGIVGIYQRHAWGQEKRNALEAWTQLVMGLGS